MTNKHIALAIGAAALLMLLAFGQPYSGTGTTVLVTNYPLQYNSNFYRLNFGGKISDYPSVIASNKTLCIGGNWLTNIVISNDYSGTIQIGTNFWRVGEIIPVGDMTRVYQIATTWLQEQIALRTNPLAAFTNYKRFTYTVNVADGLWTHTNVIEIRACSEFCTRMRYVDDGLTNDFHAAFVSYTVKTNAP